MDSVHGPDEFGKLRCTFPWHRLSVFLPLFAVARPSRQLRQRESVPVSETTSDTMSCAAAAWLHRRDSAAFFSHLFNRPNAVLCRSGRGAAPLPPESQLPLCRSRPRHLSCGQSCLSLFCLPRWCFHGSFTFYGSAVKEKSREKQRGESPDVGSIKYNVK